MAERFFRGKETSGRKVGMRKGGKEEVRKEEETACGGSFERRE
jgi:hypothetical protein